MTSHYTWGPMTTLHDFGSVLGWPLITSFELSQFHGLSSWLVCEVALSSVGFTDNLWTQSIRQSCLNCEVFGNRAWPHGSRPVYLTIHSKLRNIDLLNVTPSLICWNHGEQMFLLLVVTFASHILLGFDIKINHQRIQPTCLHTSHCHHYSDCHYCNADFVLFHNVTCYTNSLFIMHPC